MSARAIDSTEVSAKPGFLSQDFHFGLRGQDNTAIASKKDAQARMRHSKASTTMDVYMQFDSESQRRVVDGSVN